MKHHALPLLLCATALAGCATPRPAAVACADLPQAMSALPQVRVTGAQDMPADDKGNPAYCAVHGVANERTGADGRPYAIGFEMRLPSDWNHRFVQQLNGGNDGKVVPAMGALGILERNALQRGFAVISSDSGHSEDAPGNASAGLAKGNVFGEDPQARRDYGYSADDTVFTVPRP